MADLPYYLRQRLWPKRLSIAIRRSFVQFEYDPGRPWYLIQSAADDQDEATNKDLQVTSNPQDVEEKELVIAGRRTGIFAHVYSPHRPDQAIPLA